MGKIKTIFIIVVIVIILAGIFLLTKPESDFTHKFIKIDEFQITEITDTGNVYIDKNETKRADIKTFKYPKILYLKTDLQAGVEFIIKNYIFKLLTDSNIYYNSVSKELKFNKGTLIWENPSNKKKIYLILNENNQLELSSKGKISLINKKYKIWNYKDTLKLISTENNITTITNSKYIELNNNKIKLFDLLPEPKVEEKYLTTIKIKEIGDSIYTFRWQAIPNAKRYELLIYDSPLMTNIIYSKRLKTNRFSFDLLKLNNFKKIYWLVYGIDKNNIEGTPSQLKAVRIEGSLAIRKKSVKPPKLIINSLTVSGNMVIINGTTDTNAKLFINESPVKIDMDGSFIHTITYKSIGIKTIVIKAISPAELETIIEKKVTIFEE